LIQKAKIRRFDAFCTMRNAKKEKLQHSAECGFPQTSHGEHFSALGIPETSHRHHSAECGFPVSPEYSLPLNKKCRKCPEIPFRIMRIPCFFVKLPSANGGIPKSRADDIPLNAKSTILRNSPFR
jgi:hypothetical protein